MKSAPPCGLTINSGTSSIRFVVYEAREEPLRLLSGKVDRIGLNHHSAVDIARSVCRILRSDKVR